MGILEPLMSFLDCGNHNLATAVTVALFPGSPRMQNMYRSESLVSFLCEHDIIKIEQTESQHFARCSTNYAFNTRCV